MNVSFALLWMTGYVDADGRVGENEYARMQTKSVMKSQISVVNRVINSELGTDETKLPHLSSISSKSCVCLQPTACCQWLKLLKGLKP